jgi:hypothetical protein
VTRRIEGRGADACGGESGFRPDPLQAATETAQHSAAAVHTLRPAFVTLHSFHGIPSLPP